MTKFWAQNCRFEGKFSIYSEMWRTTTNRMMRAARGIRTGFDGQFVWFFVCDATSIWCPAYLTHETKWFGPRRATGRTLLLTCHFMEHDGPVVTPEQAATDMIFSVLNGCSPRVERNRNSLSHVINVYRRYGKHIGHRWPRPIKGTWGMMAGMCRTLVVVGVLRQRRRTR